MRRDRAACGMDGGTTQDEHSDETNDDNISYHIPYNLNPPPKIPYPHHRGPRAVAQ